MKIKDLPISKLYAPAEWHRPASKVDDDILCNSIAEGGIQVELVVVPDGTGKFIVADGIRRVKACQVLKEREAPCSIEECPKGEEPTEHARKLRVLLELRQDLKPSQRAAVIKTIKEQMRMNNGEVAQYLGVDADSITNWLAIDRYIPEVVHALDQGVLTQQAARVFDGMSEYGQQRVWKAEAPVLTQSPGAIHKELRRKYDPTKFAKYYRDPDKIARRLERKGPSTRKKGGKSPITHAEKSRLATSLSFKESELSVLRDEEKQLKLEINRSIGNIASIQRTPELWSMVPEEMQAELERFAEVYI